MLISSDCYILLKRNYLSKVKTMSKKTSKNKLYHLVLYGSQGITFYNLFVENNQIVEIELAIDNVFDYYTDLCSQVSDSVPFPCNIKILDQWFTASLNKCKYSLLFELQIHLVIHKIRRRIKDSDPHLFK